MLNSNEDVSLFEGPADEKFGRLKVPTSFTKNLLLSSKNLPEPRRIEQRTKKQKKQIATRGLAIIPYDTLVQPGVVPRSILRGYST